MKFETLEQKNLFTNLSPVAVADHFEVAAGAAIERRSVLTNDFDLDGQIKQVRLISEPTKAARFELFPDGTFLYVSDEDFVGKDTFTYRASDNEGSLSHETTATINVSRRGPAQSVETDFPLTINVGGDTYRDPHHGTTWLSDRYFEGGSIAIRDPNLVIEGTFVDPIFRAERWGDFSYSIPVKNGGYDVRLFFAETFSGVQEPGERVFDITVDDITEVDFDVLAKSDWASAVGKGFRTRVEDGMINISFEQKTQSPMLNAIQVNPWLYHPVANDDIASTDFEVPVQINVLANDEDVPSNCVDIDLVEPTNGTVRRVNREIFEFTPNPNFVGTDQFAYTFNCARGVSTQGTVRIDVAPPEDSSPPSSFDEALVFHLDFAQAKFSDVSGNQLPMLTGTAVTGAQPGPTLGNGRQLRSARFAGENGDQNQIILLDHPLLDEVATGAGSIATWLKVDDGDDWNSIVRSFCPIDEPICVEFSRDRGIELQSNGPSGIFGSVQGFGQNMFSFDAMGSDVWTHIVMSWDDDGDTTFFINGRRSKYTNFEGDFGLNDVANWSIGADPVRVNAFGDVVSDPGGRRLEGNLADFAIFGDSLTEIEARQIMEFGVGESVPPSFTPLQSFQIPAEVEVRKVLSIPDWSGDGITELVFEGIDTTGERPASWIRLLTSDDFEEGLDASHKITPLHTQFGGLYWLPEQRIWTNDDGFIYTTSSFVEDPPHMSEFDQNTGEVRFYGGGDSYSLTAERLGLDFHSASGEDRDPAFDWQVVNDRVHVTYGTINTNSNARPIVGPDSFELPGNEVFTSSTSVLSNDADANGDVLRVWKGFVRGHFPRDGKLEIRDDGTFTYTPNEGFHGTDSFSYRAVDSHELPSVSDATVTLNVTEPVRSPPIANDDTFTVHVGVDTPLWVLRNDSDPDNKGIELDRSYSRGSVQGVRSFNSTTYMSVTADDAAPDQFQLHYRLIDGDGLLSAPATVTVSVVPATPPKTVSDNYALLTGGSISGNIFENDVDFDGVSVLDKAQLQDVSQRIHFALERDEVSSTGPVHPARSTGATTTYPTEHGTLRFSQNGDFIYTPDEGFVGRDSVSYTLNTIRGKGAQTEVSFIVNPVTNPDDIGFVLKTETNELDIICNSDTTCFLQGINLTASEGGLSNHDKGAFQTFVGKPLGTRLTAGNLQTHLTLEPRAGWTVAHFDGDPDDLTLTWGSARNEYRAALKIVEPRRPVFLPIGPALYMEYSDIPIKAQVVVERNPGVPEILNGTVSGWAVQQQDQFGNWRHSDNRTEVSASGETIDLEIAIGSTLRQAGSISYELKNGTTHRSDIRLQSWSSVGQPHRNEVFSRSAVFMRGALTPDRVDEVLYEGEKVTAPVRELMPGDVDFDGDVDFADFLVVSENFNESNARFWSQGNFDGIGSVDFNDFLYLSANFGLEL